MAVNIYTHTQVQEALQRGLVALLLISQKIQSDFLFLYNQQYITYKDLQYDTYAIYNAVNNEQDYIGYTSTPNTYELNFYGLVGALIKFTKTVDVFGKYDGSLNPNIQSPGTTIVTIPVLLGYNSDKLAFETTGDSPQLILANYDVLYASLYGNNPILAIYDNQGQYIVDEQTPPIIEYLDNDPSKKILSITWDYGVATSGYIQISGVSPSAATGNPTNNNSAVELPFSQDDLLDAGGGNWYLPLVLASTKVPIYTQVNGISISVTYDKSNVPARLYGFANNETQSIIVTVI